jgi:hypothetical protein
MKIRRFNESVLDLDKVYYLLDLSSNIDGSYLAIFKFLRIYQKKLFGVTMLEDKNQMTFSQISRIKNGKFTIIRNYDDKADSGIIFRKDVFVETRLVSQSSNYKELEDYMKFLFTQNKYNL